MNNFDHKIKTLEAGKSKVFNNWHKMYGISKEEFIENLKWVCEDLGHVESYSGPDSGLEREIAIDANHDAQVRADNMALEGENRGKFSQPYDESKCEAHIVKLQRKYVDETVRVEFYRIDNGKRFDPMNFIGVNARDEI